MLKTVRNAIDWIAESPNRSFLFIFLLSFSIRIYQLNQIPNRWLEPSTRMELGAIAISLAKTGQFANPYIIPTGPTAHLPPIYPFIYSLIYRTFGLTSTAGYITSAFLAATSSLLYALLPWLSNKLSIGKPAGFLGGLAGAVLVDWSGHGEYLTAIGLGLIMVAFLRRWQGNRASRWDSLLLGLGIGAAFHIQPAILPVILGWMMFELWWSKERVKWTLSGLMILGMVLACLPWGWRNYTTFNTVFFIRSNFGLELRMGNHEGAAPTMEIMDSQVEIDKHPRVHFPESRLLKDISEIEYMRLAKQEALDWIKTHPTEFVLLTLQRIAYVWAGPLNRPFAAVGVSALTILAIWGYWRSLPKLTIPERAAILIPLTTFPLVYYIVAYMPRYRVPIDWILYILAGAAVWRVIQQKEEA